MDPIPLGAELIKQLATQGLGWLVASLAFIVAYVFYKQATESGKNCSAQQEAASQLRDQLQEKRVDEARGYIRVFSEGTATNEKLANAIALRTETLQQVSALVVQIQKDLIALAEAVKSVGVVVLEIQREQNARDAATQIRLKQMEDALRRNGERMDALFEDARKGR